MWRSKHTPNSSSTPNSPPHIPQSPTPHHSKPTPQRPPCRILLLGTGEGGKSTIYKHIAHTFSTPDYPNYSSPTEAQNQHSSNCMSTLILLARESYGSERYVVGDENREVEERLNRSFACGGDDDDRFRCDGGGTTTTASTHPPFTSSSSLPPTGPDLDALISFWHDPAIQQLWSERHLIRYSSLKDRTDFALNKITPSTQPMQNLAK